MKANAAAAAQSLKSQYAKTGPCGADTTPKQDGHSCGMGANAAKAPGYLKQPAPSNDGPQTIKGY